MALSYWNHRVEIGLCGFLQDNEWRAYDKNCPTRCSRFVILYIQGYSKRKTYLTFESKGVRSVMRRNINSAEWLKEKEEFHKYVMEIKKLRDEERQRGYSIITVRADEYTVDENGFLL